MSCGRCDAKGTRPECVNCSGREDRLGQKVPVIDDKCRCTEGILQLVNKDGKLYQIRMPHDPFGGSLKTDSMSQDEADYTAYRNEQRERIGDENWDGIQFEDGSSATNYLGRA